MAMNSHDTIISDLRERLETEPSEELLDRILNSAKAGKVMGTAPMRRIGVRSVTIAAAVVLAVTTACVAAPGIVKSLTAGNITVNQYENEKWPHNDVASMWGAGVWTIDGNVLTMDYDFTRLCAEDVSIETALETAQELLGAPMFVATHVEYGEEPMDVFTTSHSAGITVGVTYADAYWADEFESKASGDARMMVLRRPGSFTVYQTNVGGKPLTLDTGLQPDREYGSTTVNGFEAVWWSERGGEGYGLNYDCVGLDWVRDGVLIQLWAGSPNGNYDLAYVMRIAESLSLL